MNARNWLNWISRNAVMASGLIGVCTFASGCTQWANDEPRGSWSTPLKIFSTDRSRDEDESEKPSGSVVSVPRAREIRFEGNEIVLGDSEAINSTPWDLIEQVKTHIETEHWSLARRTTLYQSDTSRQALLQAAAGDARMVTLQLMADTLDRVEQQAVWTRLLEDRVQRAWVHDEFQAARQRTMSSMQNGDMTLALTGELPAIAERTGQSVLVAESWRLVGIAHLIAESPAQAIEAWQKGLEQPSLDLASRIDLMSLQAVALQRIGDDARASVVWQDSMRTALELQFRNADWTDFRFWKRSLEFGEMRQDWPTDVADQLGRLCVQELGPVFMDTNLARSGSQVDSTAWCYLGIAASRAELPQAALVAYKRGEIGVASPAQSWVRLAQAKMLIQLGQDQAATMILGTLATNPDPTLRQAAQATLGSMKASAGSIEQGVALLEKSLASDTANHWSGQAGFRADLGLAYLMVGRNEQGLRSLHVAQEQFQQMGDAVGLVQALENEAKYHEASGQEALARQVAERARSIEMQWALR